MEKVYERVKTLTNFPSNFCPGCGHGILVRMICEVLEEMDICDETICVLPVGCLGYLPRYLEFDNVKALHGRAPVVATAIKRLLPNRLVFAIQGDGDVAAEGLAEIIHAAARNEKISVIVSNNEVFGETGGQMTPMTLPGQVTATSPDGRNSAISGPPLKLSELLRTVASPDALIARTSIHNVKQVQQTKKLVRKAFEFQLENRAFAFVEVLSTCPPNWGVSPVDAMARIEGQVLPHFPLGILSPAGEEKRHA
jgi:2-oxoglutarate ferredoxin oxidoreductase subunit beta